MSANLAVGVYRGLLRSYPQAFRNEYGADMSLVFTDQLRNEPALRVWGRVLLDLALTVPTRHLETHMDRPRSSLTPLLFYNRNVLEPIQLEAPKFESVSINYLLHCLPGGIRSKSVVFEHLKALMRPGGVLFGATLLHDGVPQNRLARRVMDRNNAHGIFSNAQDDLEGLRSTMSRHLSDPKIDVVGCVGIFSGHA